MTAVDAVTISGANLVLGTECADGPADIWGTDPRTGQQRHPAAHAATPEEVDRAAEAGAGAAVELARWSRRGRGELLHGIAERLEDVGDVLVETAAAETGLPVEPRLRGELARTTGQLRFLAEVIADGAYLEASIDRPQGAPELRRLLVPVGPVAVFGASNFPLAFSVPGGDTAAALAVGCPVLAKAHPAHPHTSELAGRAIVSALADAGAPSGAFALLHGLDAGRRLVAHPSVAAVSFTGSPAGGLALAALAREREVPIPVFAEMGSLNPVVVTAAAVRVRGPEIAAGLLGSVAGAAGQLCTKPGIVLVPEGAGVPDLGSLLAEIASATEAQPVLTSGIARHWREWIERVTASDADVVMTPGPIPPQGSWAAPAMISVDVEGYLRDDRLREECFGPVTVLVRYRDRAELTVALAATPGSLTGTVHAGDTESAVDEDARYAAELLVPLVGRLIWNGWPTGVAVTWSMHHGGPYPATLDAAHTSVGAGSLRRFLRPVTFQGVPDDLLPAEVRDVSPGVEDGPVRRDGGRLHVPR